MNTTQLLEQAKQAREAGFDSAAADLELKAALATKLAKAYEHFRYVSKEAVAEFQKKTLERTERNATSEDQRRLNNPYVSRIADQLVFCRMETYKGLPPADVLKRVSEVKAMGIFDAYEVAEIQPVATQQKLPDPIVFGLVNGCTDRFYVAEWGEDVSINDLLGKHDG